MFVRFLCYDLHWQVTGAADKCQKVKHKANWPPCSPTQPLRLRMVVGAHSTHWMVVGIVSLVQKGYPHSQCRPWSYPDSQLRQYSRMQPICMVVETHIANLGDAITDAATDTVNLWLATECNQFNSMQPILVETYGANLGHAAECSQFAWWWGPMQPI